MEDQERILVNKISKEKYVKERVKIVVRRKMISSIIYLMILAIFSMYKLVGSEGLVVAVLFVFLMYCVIEYILIEYIKARKYYNLHIGKEGEEVFIFLPEGFKRQGETKLVNWLNLPKVKSNRGIISFHYGTKGIVVWDEKCMSNEIKQYLKTKLRGLNEF